LREMATTGSLKTETGTMVLRRILGRIE